MDCTCNLEKHFMVLNHHSPCYDPDRCYVHFIKVLIE